MAGLGGALAGLAGSYNQAWDEERRMTLAARLEKQRDENRIKITPTDSVLTTGPDGVVYRQAVNAMGEPVGPQRALSDIERTALSQQQEQSRLALDTDRQKLTAAQEQVRGLTLENEINQKYGPQQAEQALRTSQAQEVAARAGANSANASASRNSIEASLIGERAARERQALSSIDEVAQADGPPSPDQMLDRAAWNLNPDAAAANRTSPRLQQMTQPKLSDIMRMGTGLMKSLDTFAEDNDITAEDEPGKYAKIVELRNKIQSAANAGDTTRLQMLEEEMSRLMLNGLTTSTDGGSTAPDVSSDAARNLVQGWMK